MTACTEILNQDRIQVSISISTTMGDWRRLVAQLEAQPLASSHPAWEFLSLVRGAIGLVEKNQMMVKNAG